MTRGVAGSFNRHALGEVARLVHVAPSEDGDVVGEQFQRNDGQQGEQWLDGGGQINHIVGISAAL